MKKNKIIIIISVLLLFGLSVGGFLYLKAKSEYKSSVSNLSGYVLGTGVAPDLTPEEIRAYICRKKRNYNVCKSKI